MEEKNSVLITGVTSGIGQAMLTLCLDAHMAVTATVRNHAQQIDFEAKAKDQLTVIQADLSHREQVEEMANQIKGQAFKYILLNAGTAEVGVFGQLSAESIDTIMETNLLSNMRLIHAMLPSILKNQSKVVFISSLVANAAAGKYASYAVSKAGLSQFYRCLKKEYPQLPLLCIEIGAVDTPMHQKSGNEPRSKKFFKSQEVISKRLYQAMINRTGLHTLSFDWAIIRKLVRLIG